MLMSVRIVYNGFIKLFELNECDKKKPTRSNLVNGQNIEQQTINI